MSALSFIETKGSLQRVQKVLNCIRSGIPVLIEGETGTAKTKTAMIAAQRNKQQPILLNFSSQTTIEDLLGRITRSVDSWSGFSFKNGPYTDAYEKGDCLILDEINLAHETVLQCIEASLDSGTLSLEVSGSETKIVRMHPNFHIIATQNPLTGRFSQKRQYLSHKFRSRFQTIKFSDIDKEELFEIALGLSKSMLPDFENAENSIKKLIDFHFIWKEQEEKMNQIHVFTIREIAGTILSMADGLSPYEAILIHYGSRYDNQKLETMKEMLLNRSIGFEKAELILKLPPTADKSNLFYLTKSLKRSIINSNHLLKTFHPLLFVGSDGCGKTSFARWVAQIFSQKSKLFVCNPEMAISDIIGRFMPLKGESGEAPIKWIDGPVIQSVKNGDCLIMDQIDTAPSTILERLNSLYDCLGTENNLFNVQENSEESEIIVNPDFRIIATASYKGLNDLSPAFLNRFTIVFIDDQIPELYESNENLYAFIKHFAPISHKKTDIQHLITEINKLTKNEMTASRISMIVRGFFSLRNKFSNADSMSICQFCFEATSGSTTIPTINEEFINLLLGSLGKDIENSEFDTFHYKNATSTRKVMATLVACSMIGLHVVMVGKTGLGKTASAIAFSRINQISKGSQIVSFNGETQLEELFGFFTIEKGNFTQHDGPLSNAMIEGQVFIADELNLADQQIIQSLNVAIEPIKHENVILPVVGKAAKVNEGFFFIGCQNDKTMHGRRQLPESFRKKVLCFEYPENSHSDLLSLTSSLAEQFKLPRSAALGTTTIMEKMKEDFLFKTKPWSLREVRKLFRRTSYFLNQGKNATNLTIERNATFLLRSSFRKKEGITEKSVDLVSIAFNLNESSREFLLKDMNASVTVVLKRESVLLIKGSMEIKILYSDMQQIPKQLQSYWQTLFEVSITHPSEPLLMVGPSGFKTFLSKSISPLAPIVYLHSDSTISSLIGQISLLDKYQAKIFLLDSLHDFLGTNQLLEEQFSRVKKIIQNDNLFVHVDSDDGNRFRNKKDKKFDDLIEAIMKIIPKSFTTLVNNVVQQIKSIDNQDFESYTMFSNYTSLFKPGLITKAIFQQKSLILKNIAQPSPTVLERFNELLSVTPTLTLFEDTSNTFTPANSKTIYNFSEKFRIIGTCLPSEKRGLSEAMLSRLTEIYVPEYTKDEQNFVFESIFKSNFLNDVQSNQFYSMLKNILERFEKSESNDFSFSIPFTRVVAIIRIASKWSHSFFEDQSISKEQIFAIALFRCGAGPFPPDYKIKFIKALKETNLALPESLEKVFIFEENEFLLSNRESILKKSETEDKGFTYKLINVLTNFSMETSSMEDVLNPSKILFTPLMNDLIDLVFSAATINHPLIIEGGSGKSSAFHYVAESMNAEVIRISISSSTTVEDLFGKYEPNASSEVMQFDFLPTNFLNSIRIDKKEENIGHKYWIIVEELHLASASVLDALGPVFNPYIDKILLPNGSIVTKGEYFIVGLTSKPLQRQSITNTAMFYKSRDYNQKEFTDICRFFLENNYYSSISDKFCEIISNLKDISSSSQVKIPVTIREVYKYLNLLSATEQDVDPLEVLRILCLGRFIDKENVLVAQQELGFTDEESTPEINIENGGTKLNTGEVKFDISTRTSTRKSELLHLTSSEQKLFRFLAMSVKNNYAPIIIQGSTASGKTYSIQLFADIIGQPLRVIQLNSEINSSIISGQFQPSKNLSELELKDLQYAISLVKDFSELPQIYLDKIQNEDIRNWIPDDFKELRKIIEKLAKEMPNGVEKDNAKIFLEKVDKSLHFFNHLKRSDSLIVKSLLEGSWLLLDGIESAPSDLFDRIYTLLDDYPTLNIYERGNDYLYTLDSEDKNRRIHPNFRLLMTFNPVDVHSMNNISPSFLSRCTIFSMQPIDSKQYDISIVISGLLQDTCFEFCENSLEIAIRLSKIHSIAKAFSQSQNIFITGRTFVHMCRTIKYIKTVKSIEFKDLKEIIEANYCCSMEETEEFLKEIDEEFSKQVDANILEELQKAQRSTSKSCDLLISMINSYEGMLLKENIHEDFYLFNTNQFFFFLQTVQLKDIEQVYERMHYLFKVIERKANILVGNILHHLSSLKTLEILLKDLNNICINIANDPLILFETIESDNVKDISDFSVIISKIQCMTTLQEKGYLVMFSPPIFLFSDLCDHFFTLLEKVINNHSHNEILNSYQKFSKCNSSRYLFEQKDCPFLFINSLNFFYKSNNFPIEIQTAVQKISSCLFFDPNYGQKMFTGVTRIFYLATVFLVHKFDLKLINDWMNYMNEFFVLFNSLPFCFEIKVFRSILESYLESEDQEVFNQHMRDLKRIQVAFPRQLIKINDYEEINNVLEIVCLINKINDKFETKYNEIFLKQALDQEAANKVIKLKNEISQRLDKGGDLFTPLNYFYKYMSEIGSITTDKSSFLFQIYRSIKVQSKKELKPFLWPNDISMKFDIFGDNSLPVFDYLIEYSNKINKIDLFITPNWMEISDIDNPDYILKEYISNQSISKETIGKYEFLQKAELLFKLSQIEENGKMNYSYCSRSGIIKYLNKFNDRFNEIDPKLINIANKFQYAYSDDFTLTVPYFVFSDILSLIVNPFDQSKGPLMPSDIDSDFLCLIYEKTHSINNIKKGMKKLIKMLKHYLNEKLEEKINSEDFESFDEMIDHIMTTNKISKHLQEISKAFQIIFKISQQIRIDKIAASKLEFKDIIFEDYESYLNNSPCSGYYLVKYPEILPMISKMFKLSSETKFPLSLFGFRIFSNSSIIKIEIPSGIPHNADIIISEISRIIINNLKNEKIKKFSNLIGFLFDQPPSKINTHRTEHFRNILISFIMTPESKVLVQALVEYFLRKLERFILLMGNEKWDLLMEHDFYQKENKENKKKKENKENNENKEIIDFLINPWYYTLSKIREEFEQEKQIKDTNIREKLDFIHNKMNSFASPIFMKKIEDAIEKDEINFQKILEEEFSRISIQKGTNPILSACQEDLLKKWKKVSQQYNKALGVIPKFPQTDFPYNDFYQKFYEHFKDNPTYLPLNSHNTNIIVIKLKENKKTKDKTITIKSNQNKNGIQGKFNEKNNMTLMKLEEGKSFQEYGFSSDDADISFITVVSDQSIEPANKFSQKELYGNYYPSFIQALNRIKEI